MIHHYLSTEDSSGDHYAVGRSGMTAKVLVQVQAQGEQLRLAVSPSQARHFAQLLLAEADRVDSK